MTEHTHRYVFPPTPLYGEHVITGVCACGAKQEDRPSNFDALQAVSQPHWRAWTGSAAKKRQVTISAIWD